MLKHKGFKAAVRSVAMLLLTAVVTVGAAVCANAEGSRDLVKSGQGYRPYIEWDPNATLGGIPRQTILKVYAEKGETLCFGSSTSMALDGNDIVVRDPSGVESIYQNNENGNGVGFITTRQHEEVGPYPERGGYTPHTVAVSQTGIWEFEFHAVGNVSSNPPETSVESAMVYEDTNSIGIAAWDVTVKDKAGKAIDGRMFTNYVSINLAGYGGGMYSTFYLVTKDGYRYKVETNGLRPFGFIFYTNNRGLIDCTSHTTLYKYAIPNSGESITSAPMFKGNIKAQLPIDVDTETDVTHRIFFNEPAEDLPESVILSEAEPPAKVTNFKFTGIHDSETGVGAGGVFTFEVDKKTTYEIIIDVNGDGKYTADTQDVLLSDAAAPGSNTCFWDGTDGLGNKLAEGDYHSEVETKGGEYHLPFVDVEYMPDGVKGTLLNPPYIPDNFNVSTLFYDASDYVAADGTEIVINSASGGPDPVNGLDGVYKASGIMGFGADFGNEKVADIWASFPGTTDSTTVSVSNKIIDKNAFLTGTVFFDRNANKIYDIDEQPLSDIDVRVAYGNAGNYVDAKTDNAGRYVVSIPQNTNYTVSVNKFEVTAGYKAGYVLTTGNDVQTGTTPSQSKQVFLQDVGYNMDVDVGVEASAPEAEYVEGDQVTYTIKAINTTNLTATNVKVAVPLPPNTTYVSDTGEGQYDYKSGDWTIGIMSPNEEKTITITAVLDEAVGYRLVATITADKNIDGTNDKAEVVIKAENREPKPDDLMPCDPVVTPEKTLTYDYAYLFTAYTYGDSQLLIEPGKLLKRGEMAAILYKVIEQNNKLEPGFAIPAKSNYPDLTIKDNYFTALEYMTYIGAYNPNGGANRIQPEMTITRGEAAMMIAFALGLGDTDNVCNFTDLSESHMFYRYINALVAKNYLSGDGTTFRPNDRITRAEFVKIFNNIIGRTSDYNFVTDIKGRDVTTVYTDIVSTDWYYADIMRATHSFTKLPDSAEYRVDDSKEYVINSQE